MKKGVSYVDVAISASIFILYLLFIFVTLKPGIKEDIKGDYLLQIISSKLSNKIIMNMSKYPLFINYHDGNINDPWDPNNENVIVEFTKFPFNWSENKTKILDKNYNDIKFNITPSQNTLNLTIEATRFNLIFGSPDDQPDTFFITNSDDFNFSANFAEPPANQHPRLINDDNNNFYNFRFGTKEIIFGIGEEKLNNTNDDYQQLKQEFNFPEDKEFAFTVYEGKSPNNVIYSYSKVIPTETEKNIFVLQWSDLLIKKDGTTIPIIINLRAW